MTLTAQTFTKLVTLQRHQADIFLQNCIQIQQILWLDVKFIYVVQWAITVTAVIFAKLMNAWKILQRTPVPILMEIARQFGPCSKSQKKRADELSTKKITVLLNFQVSDTRDVISCAWEAV